MILEIDHVIKDYSGGVRANDDISLHVDPGEVFGPQSRQPALLFCPDKPRIVRAEVEQEFAAR